MMWNGGYQQRSSRPVPAGGFSASTLAFPEPHVDRRATPFQPPPPSPGLMGPGSVGGFAMPSPSLGAPPPPPQDYSERRLTGHAQQQAHVSRPHKHAHHSHSHSHSHQTHTHTHTHHTSSHTPRPSHSANASLTHLPVPSRPHQASHHSAPHLAIPQRPPHSTRLNSAPHHAAQTPVPHLPPAQVQHYGPQLLGPNKQRVQPFFQYSQCTGRKKALCIGINYRGQSNALKGCVNDAKNVRDFLIQRYGYKDEDIVLLTDDARTARQVPTRKNLIEAMRWLVADAQPNDSLFFHYSGHGGQTKDLDGDEADGYDEVIFPIDYKTKGQIVDDEMHMIMVRPLPPGCRLTALFDSCHSGSALDLPYEYSSSGRLKDTSLAAEAGHDVLGAVGSYQHGDINGVINAFGGLLKKTGGGRKAERYARATRASPADVISWSACKDSQTSADTTEAGKATGAMSYAFMSSLKRNPHQSFQELLSSIRDILRRRYSQKPQLSSSHPIDTSLIFIA